MFVRINTDLPPRPAEVSTIADNEYRTPEFSLCCGDAARDEGMVRLR